MSVYIFTIEGNIGSGKSTLCTHLRKHYAENVNIIFLDEPVSEWMALTDSKGANIIEKYYENQAHYAFPFQILAFTTRLSRILVARKNAIESGRNTVIVTERCLHTDNFVFAQMLRDEGTMEEIQYRIYERLFSEFSEMSHPHCIIYLRADVNICSQRIISRGRPGENNISIAYLEKCHQYHEMYTKKCSVAYKLTLDGNNDIHKDSSIIHSWTQQIHDILVKNEVVH